MKKRWKYSLAELSEFLRDKEGYLFLLEEEKDLRFKLTSFLNEFKARYEEETNANRFLEVFTEETKYLRRWLTESCAIKVQSLQGLARKVSGLLERYAQVQPDNTLWKISEMYQDYLSDESNFISLADRRVTKHWDNRNFHFAVASKDEVFYISQLTTRSLLVYFDYWLEQESDKAMIVDLYCEAIKQKYNKGAFENLALCFMEKNAGPQGAIAIAEDIRSKLGLRQRPLIYQQSTDELWNDNMTHETNIFIIYDKIYTGRAICQAKKRLEGKGNVNSAIVLYDCAPNRKREEMDFNLKSIIVDKNFQIDALKQEAAAGIEYNPIKREHTHNLSKQLGESIKWFQDGPNELNEYVEKWVAVANNEIAGYGSSPVEATNMAMEKTGLPHGEFLVKYIHDIDVRIY